MPRINVKAISLKELRPLWDDWLVATGIISETQLSESNPSPARHLGALRRGAIVGIVSLCREPRPAMIEARAWRLLGLAVAPSIRRQGYGRTLVEAAERHVVRSNGNLLWANVPTDSCDFFCAMKFEVVGDAFEVHGLGLHHRVLLRPKRR